MGPINFTKYPNISQDIFKLITNKCIYYYYIGLLQTKQIKINMLSSFIRRNAFHKIMQEGMSEADLLKWFISKRATIEELLKHRFFYKPSFDIYGGVSGLYDYGPPGCALKREIEDLWRRHFILEEDMLELSGTNLTPEIVLEASGHVAKFSDFMVRDTTTDRCYRADKYLIENMDKLLKKAEVTAEQQEEFERIKSKADTYSPQELHEIFQKFNILSEENNPLSFPEPFNLMFATSIGPSGKHRGFLRPETAQGIFVNFKNLYDFNRNRLPFAAAQIGLGFRNEISPRDGLLRVREFTMAEIEHFVNPNAKDHTKFPNVAELKVPLYSQEQQEILGGHLHMTIGEAVERKIINNQTLGYYMARTYLFLVECGVRKEAIRFRQHMKDEMAHYAADCWDAEILSSYDWVECVGIADRSCYDLTRHAEKSKKNLQAAEKYETPKIVEFIDMKTNKGAIAKAYKQKTQDILAYLAELPEASKAKIRKDLEENKEVSITINENNYVLNQTMIAPVDSKKTINQEVFYPSVIEPSFGIGRILYSVLEHAYRERENLQEARNFLCLSPTVAPIKCCVLPLSKNDLFDSSVAQLKESIKRKGLSCEVDSSSSTIGKRYARCDEVGIPFAVTVDFQTTSDNTVTLREAIGMTQVRMPLPDVAKIIRKLVNKTITWENITGRYPTFSANNN